jgi:acetylglutamate kinase
VKILIKLGGALLDAADSRERLAREIAELARHDRVVVVHGGGRQMTRYLAERGIESTFVNGLRVTTPEVIDAVIKVFAGSVNAELVSAFRVVGARPVGLSGQSVVDAVQLDPNLGRVGRPVSCNGRLLDLLVAEGYLPVVACVAGDSRGAIYNVNGDQMAVACAAGFRADRLIFLTDVEGVRDASGQTCAQLTTALATELIRNGIATGGMRAKLEAATSALSQGVLQVLIAPGAHTGIIAAIRANEPHIGTTMVPN